MSNIHTHTGELAWATWPCGDAASPVADDVGSIERVFRGNQQEHDQMTLSCIRSLLNMFMIAYRLIHWIKMSSANTAPLDEEEDVEHLDKCIDIHQHHVSASNDHFHIISMYYDLPPAARLNYRHTFSGLYNCISQPVYFHNPEYERRLQLPLQSIRDCELDISTLPVIMQVYPEITILYDDDYFKTALPQSVSALCVTERKLAWRYVHA